MRNFSLYLTDVKHRQSDFGAASFSVYLTLLLLLLYPGSLCLSYVASYSLPSVLLLLDSYFCYKFRPLNLTRIPQSLLSFYWYWYWLDGDSTRAGYSRWPPYSGLTYCCWPQLFPSSFLGLLILLSGFCCFSNFFFLSNTSVTALLCFPSLYFLAASLPCSTITSGRNFALGFVGSATTGSKVSGQPRTTAAAAAAAEKKQGKRNKR